jgi:pimeloyl-ACP methyl ester carboxylesterase
MVMPTKRMGLRREPWLPIFQQLISGAVNFKLSIRVAAPKPWPMRSDCDLQQIESARIPFLAIIGRHESVHNGPKTATLLRQQLPEARIELVDDANHMILIDQPEIVDKLLVEFLQ